LKNVTYIISNINKAIAFEWICNNIDKNKFNISFVLLNPGDSALQTYCLENKIVCYSVNYKSKKNIPLAIIKTLKLLKRIRTDIVHCHLVDAGLVGLAAARLAGIKKRIYTRHHSTFHFKYFPNGVKYDKWINRNATNLVAISNVVSDVLIVNEGVAPEKVSIIHHGFDIDAFKNVSPIQIQELKNKYHLKNKPTIGVVSRYLELKGIQYVIPAFVKILENNPSAHLVLANGNGNYTREIRKLLESLPNDSYTEIEFEYNNFALFHLFDIFIHVPIDKQIEAFGQTYVESLAAGVPSVFTLSGIANDFAIDKENCLLVPYMNSQSIVDAVQLILDKPLLKEHLIKNGYLAVEKLFSLKYMIKKLENLYE
jgi:glycosyltransferase involved in cell wall biosynthesis